VIALTALAIPVPNMQLLLLVDIAAFYAERERVLSRCLLAVGRLLRSAERAEPAARFAYRLIDSRCKPEAFVTRYKAVAGHGDSEFPAMDKGAELLYLPI
jgi:hypothetical protein